MHIPFDIDVSSPVQLHTKNLNCQYERGRLRYIKAGDMELVRMVYGAVRDADWGTVVCTITDEYIQQREDGFTIKYTSHYQQNDIEYKAVYHIEGGPDDTIAFEIKGKALSVFKSNRIGVCVHLPTKDYAGMQVSVIHPTEEKTTTSFPENISPQQPFSQIQQLHWKTNNNIEIELAFAGDIFEAEDQRNWMDHSYKIYNRPLSCPFPFQVQTGDTMQQSVYIKVTPGKYTNDTTEITEKTVPVTIPSLGIAAANEPALLTSWEIFQLQGLSFTHYRVELDFETDWRKALDIHTTNAEAIGVSLELILFYSDNYTEEIKALIEAITDAENMISSILPLHKNYKVTPIFLQEYFYPLFKKRFPGIPVGYGTDAYFADLNRLRPANDWFDFLSFSLNPQVHSFDTQTILENINTFPDIMRTIRSFTDKPVFISPLTLKKRKNHDGTGNSRLHLVNNYDERQHCWFGAGWLLLSLFQLQDARQITLFKTTGDSGVIGITNKATPLFQVLLQLKLFGAVTISKKIEGHKIRIIFRNKAGKELTFLNNSLYRV